MNIALLFFGQPRFIENNDIFESYKHNIINKYNVDIYCHCWWSHKQIEYETSSWAKIKSCPIPKNAPGIILEKYNPQKIIFEQPKEFLIAEKLYSFFQNTQLSLKDYNNTCSQLYSIQEVSRCVPKQYDMYILARYDCIIHNCLNYSQIDINKLYCSDHHRNMPDMILSFGEKFLNWSQNLYDDIPIIYKELKSPTPESFKKQSFLKRYIDSDIRYCKMNATALRG